MPPKKKRKLVAPEAETSSMDIVKDSSIAAKISLKDLLTKELIGQLGDLESRGSSVGDSASISLLKLKSLQRSVLEKIRKTQQLLKQQAVIRDQQELKLENLRYQEAIYKKSKQEADSAVESTTLEIARLVRKSQNSTNENEQETSELLNNFLGEDWKDPSKREAIVAKLNDDVATRKKLKEELNQMKDDRKSKQDSLASRKKLLKDLPFRLAEMEKASLPLQKFCQKHSSSSPSLMKTASKLGTAKRRSRLDLAKDLPKALYTLFHQLQSCLDVMETNEASLEAVGIIPDALPTVEIQKDSTDVVMLKIPIPTLSSGGEMSYRPKKQATVAFRYDTSLDVVLAACGTDYDMGQTVIDELFPGDKGEFSWNTINDTSTGKPYQWCNYLAGLHVSPVEQTAAKMHSSAKVIVQALVRRVRAIATLSWILHGLSRKPNLANFPTHPALREKDQNSKTKLSSWTALKIDSSESNNKLCVYKAVLQHGNGKASKKLVAKVSFNLARYPSSIPRWKIFSSTDENQEEDCLDLLQENREGEAPQDLPLYDDALARLEQEVNQKVDELVIPSDQTTYDWILVQQLTKIAEGWEDSLQE